MRSAIVTGSANGIGATVAELLASNGYRVGILDLDEGAVETHCQSVGGFVPCPAMSAIPPPSKSLLTHSAKRRTCSSTMRESFASASWPSRATLIFAR